MSLSEFGLCEQKGWTGGGSPWSRLGTDWAISLLLCTKGLRKQASSLVGPPFWQCSFFLSVWANIGWELWLLKLISEWVWLVSQICTGWLQGHLCEIWSVKTQGNKLKEPMALKCTLNLEFYSSEVPHYNLKQQLAKQGLECTIPKQLFL